MIRLRALPGQVTAVDREWQARARRLTLDSLYDIRAVAGRWAATIGSLTVLLSLVALVAGPSLVDRLSMGWRIAAGCLVLAAILAAGFATWCAADAAQGRTGATLSTYAQVRDRLLEQERTAAKLLRRARIAVVAAMVALTAAVALSWFVPQESTEYLLIRRGTAVSCIPLNDDITLSLTIDATSSVQIVKKCP